MTLPDDARTHDPPARPAYRIPFGLPLRDEGRREGAIVSVLVHAVIIALLLMPIVLAGTLVRRIDQGAGGRGPAGGGGGGRGGVTGLREMLRFVRVARDPVPTPTTLPPVPAPVVPKPVPVVTPPVQPAVKAPEDATVPSFVSTGTGPGSGHDGTAGNGPGSGGGIGSGIGPGRGSGVGPGTGGGTQANYLPQPIEFFLPPLPPPSSVRGFRFTAEFDVDSTGHVLDIKFTETRDGDYNRRLASVLRSMRFRPGTRPDGTPMRMKAQVGYEF
jgi:protein TonB